MSFYTFGIARNNDGFEELNRYLSHHKLTDKPLRKRAPEFEHAYVIYPLEAYPKFLRENEYIGVKTHQVNQLISHKEKIKRWWHGIRVTFRHRQDFNIHRLLRAIDNNTILSKLPADLQASPDEMMIPEKDLKAYYEQYPGIIRNTENLLCRLFDRF